MAASQQGTELPNIRLSNTDPTLAPGVKGIPNQLLITTDTNDLYYFKGPLDTNWSLLSGAIPPGAVLTDGVTLQGDGTALDKIRVKAIQHDTTLVQNGTVALPMGVNPNLIVNSLEATGGNVVADNGDINATNGDINSTNGDVNAPNGSVNAQNVNAFEFFASVGGGSFGTFDGKALGITGQTPVAVVIAGVNNNYDAVAGQINRLSLIELNVDPAGATITGMPAAYNQYYPAFWNNGANDLIIKNLSGLSVAPNRFKLPGGVDFVIPIGGIATFHGDQVAGQWLLISKNF